jgi:hypothetical protein
VSDPGLLAPDSFKIQPLSPPLNFPFLFRIPLASSTEEEPRVKVPFQPINDDNTSYMVMPDQGPNVVCNNSCSNSDNNNSGDDSKKVFDSEKKPARGILKRKGKFSDLCFGSVGDRSVEFNTLSISDKSYSMLLFSLVSDPGLLAPDSFKIQPLSPPSFEDMNNEGELLNTLIPSNDFKDDGNDFYNAEAARKICEQAMQIVKEVHLDSQ